MLDGQSVKRTPIDRMTCELSRRFADFERRKQAKIERKVAERMNQERADRLPEPRLPRRVVYSGSEGFLDRVRLFEARKRRAIEEKKEEVLNGRAEDERLQLTFRPSLTSRKPVSDAPAVQTLEKFRPAKKTPNSKSPNAPTAKRPPRLENSSRDFGEKRAKSALALPGAHRAVETSRRLHLDWLEQQTKIEDFRRHEESRWFKPRILEPEKARKALLRKPQPKKQKTDEWKRAKIIQHQIDRDLDGSDERHREKIEPGSKSIATSPSPADNGLLQNLDERDSILAKSCLLPKSPSR